MTVGLRVSADAARLSMPHYSGIMAMSSMVKQLNNLLRITMTALLKNSRSSCTSCTFRSFVLSRLVLMMLATILEPLKKELPDYS
jgi:hypothetical protein